MRRNNKIISILIVICILGSFTVHAEIAPGGEVSQSYEEAFGILSALNIMKGYGEGGFKPENTLTKAEMCTIITNIIFPEQRIQHYTASKSFSDVQKDYWAYNQIAISAELGLVSGYAGRFEPESELTYHQAIKIIVLMLGYDLMAEISGGYPTGHVIEAQKLGLLKGVANTKAYQEPISRKDIAQIVYNALEVPLLKQISFTNKIQYEKTEGRNLLSEYLKTYKVEGQITANDFSSIDGSSNVKKGNVTIKDKKRNTNITANIGTTNADEMLGLGVLSLVKDEHYSKSGEFEIIYIQQDNTYIKTVQLKAYEIDSFDENTYALQYFKEGNSPERKLKISRGIELVVNGGYTEFVASDQLLIKQGDILFVDYNRDNVYDLAIVNSYYNIVVKTRSLATGIVTDIYDDTKKIELDYDDASLSISMKDTDQHDVTILDITEYTVLSVYESGRIDGNKKMKVVMNNQRTDGISDEITGTEKIVIDGKGYRLSYDFVKKQNGLRYINIGSLQSFCLDGNNEVCGVVASGGLNDMKQYTDFSYGMNYGYALNAKALEFEKSRIKLFTVKGSIEIFDLAESVELNQQPMSAAQAVALLKNTSDGLAEYTQLIKFKTNKNNEIKTLSSAISGSSDGYKDDGLLYLDAQLSNSWVSGVLGPRGEYFATENTAVFVIPTDIKQEKNLKVLAGNALKMQKVNISIYDVSSRDIAGAVAVKGTVSPTYENDDPSYILERISQIATPDGEIKTQFAFMKKNGTSANYTFSDVLQAWEYTDTTKPLTANDMRVGDVVRLYLDPNDSSVIHGLRRIFCLEKFLQNPSEFYWETGRDSNTDYAQAYGDLLRWVIGYAEDKGETFLRLKIKKSPTYDTDIVGDYKKSFFTVVPNNPFGGYIVITQRPDGQLMMAPGTIDDIKTAAEVGEENASLIFFKNRYETAHEVYIFNLQN